MKRSTTVLPLLAVTALGCSSASSLPATTAYRTSYAGPATTQGYARTATATAVTSTPVVEDLGPGASAAEGEGLRAGAQPSAPPTDLPASLRPGLATHWGEDRYSTVRTTPFERASARPFDVATLHYNDARLASLQARREGFRWLSMHRDGFRISLRGEAGEVLPGFLTGGDAFVIGRPGERYSIVLENHTSARIEAVLTVDGLDVINGQAGSTENRGYLVRPFGTIVVEGFRRSASTVAAFRFGGVEGSYAEDRGSTRNVGVIGVALFAERGAEMDLDENEVELRRTADPFPGGFAPPPSARIAD